MELTGEDFPSLYTIKKIVTELSGVKSLMHHMCLDSCYAFVVPQPLKTIGALDNVFDSDMEQHLQQFVRDRVEEVS
ncbi:hypothetical protein DFH29DRAFT_1003713 [Suillus ampliporus]|nr:hypothetical protein DFH29DRAFT_1003713 [Suillus ampliporus]